MALPPKNAPEPVISPRISTRQTKHQAFSLVELAVVMAILITLTAAGIHLFKNTATHARKCGTELLTSLVENARSSAMTSRRHVIIAIAEPGDLTSCDGRCRIGLFKVDAWPEPFDGEVSDATQLGRWHPLERGLTAASGSLENLDNPLDQSELIINYGNTTNPRSAKVHAVVINPHGSIKLPAGSNPLLMRIAEGAYRNGKAIQHQSANNGATAENKIKIGRVVARAYRIDG